MGVEASASPCIRAAYRIFSAAVAPLIALHLLARQAMGKESRLSERWGRATRRRPDGRLLWLHASSLGEGAAALPIIVKILEEMPSASVLVTGGSVAADEWRRRRFPAGVITQFVPVDTPAAVRRFVTHWKPEVGIFIESELWPNLIEISRTHGVALALVNARISDASARVWRVPVCNWLFRDTVRHFRVVSSTSDAERDRLLQLGVTRDQMIISADLKLVSAAAILDATTRGGGDEVDGQLAIRSSPSVWQPLSELPCMSTTRRRFWLCASTHEGEEDACARVHMQLRRRFPTLLTCVVPRHAERSTDIRAALTRKGLSVATFSRGERVEPHTDVYVIDVVGILPEMYTASRGLPVFVGGSLVPGGKGHNVAEATLAGCAVLVGPYLGAFRSMIDSINDGGTSGADAVESCTMGSTRGNVGDEGAKVCEVVATEMQLVDSVMRRLDDQELSMHLGDTGMVRTQKLLSGVLEQLWLELSPRLFTEMD